jgi:hypothetical protein
MLLRDTRLMVACWTQLLSMVDQAFGRRQFAVPVGQILYGQRGRGDRQHQGGHRHRVNGLRVPVRGHGCRRSLSRGLGNLAAPVADQGFEATPGASAFSAVGCELG